MITLYEVLGVDRKAKSSTLRTAYRKLAKANHPDVNQDPQAHERMAEINSAFQTLIDPVQRMEYDATIGVAVPTRQAEDPRQYEEPNQLHIKLVHRLKGHRTPVYSVSFAPDTGNLVTSSFDNEVLWWDRKGFEVKRRLKLEGGVVSIVRALEQDRVVAAGSSESVVSVWVLENDRINSWRNSPLEWVACVAVSSDGRNVAMGSVYHTLQVCRAKTGDAVFAGTTHSQGVTAVAWSGDNRFIATGSADATVKLWSGVSGRELHTFKAVRSTVTAVAFSPDNEYLAVAAVDLSIRIFRLSDLTLVKTFFGHEKPVESLAFHPDGMFLGSTSRDGTVCLWNVLHGQNHVQIDASNQPLSTIGFSPDGKHMVAGGLDRIVRVWELNFGSVSAKESASASAN